MAVSMLNILLCGTLLVPKDNEYFHIAEDSIKRGVKGDLLTGGYEGMGITEKLIYHRGVAAEVRVSTQALCRKPKTHSPSHEGRQQMLAASHTVMINLTNALNAVLLAHVYLNVLPYSISRYLISAWEKGEAELHI